MASDIFVGQRTESHSLAFFLFGSMLLGLMLGGHSMHAQSLTGAQPASTPASQINAPSTPSHRKSHQKSDDVKAKRLQAEQQLQQEEHQRILRFVPNFNTTNIQNALPLSPGQKFQLAVRSVIDPFNFVATGAVAGIEQADDTHSGYGQGASGYFQRYGAAFADNVDGIFWGNAVYPILLREDPRYFRKGVGSTWSRFLYSLSTAVRTKDDNGNWGWNYANILGNLTAGGISNFYYPPEDRGVALTFEGAATVTAEGGVGALFIEFWPDISRKLFHRHDRNSATPSPK